LHGGNQVVSRKTAADFGIDPADASTLGGILGEQTLFCDALQGAAAPICTLSNTLQTQQVREALSTLLAQGGRGVIELDLAQGSEFGL
jgi:hypothetical protein